MRYQIGREYDPFNVLQSVTKPPLRAALAFPLREKCALPINNAFFNEGALPFNDAYFNNGFEVFTGEAAVHPEAACLPEQALPEKPGTECCSW